MNVNLLLNEAIRKKPASNRASRKRSSSTPDDIIRMNYNENQYGMSPKAYQAFVEATAKSSYYPDFFAIDLKTALAKEFNLEWANIITVAGSSALIDMVGAIFINPGDEVLFCEPTFDAFRDMANDYGATCVTAPLDENMCFDLDALYSKITDKTKIIVICNPNNPTGGHIASDKVEAFIRKVPESILVVVDEAYIEYVDREENSSMVRMIQSGYDKPMIVLRTFSKIHGMAGLRVGYGIASAEIADEFGKSSHAWNVSNVGQATAVAALNDKEYVKDVRAKNKECREYITAELSKLGCKVYPSQTNFIFFDSKLAPADMTAKLKEKKILIGTFASSRVSIGTMDQSKKFIAAVAEILSE